MAHLTPAAKAAVAVALLAMTLATRAPLLLQHQAIDDEVFYATIAHEMLAGGQLYVTAVDRKPPLLFWVYTGVFKVVGAYNWLGLHLVSVGWVLLTMAGLFVIARRLFDADAGLIAAGLYSVFQPWAYGNNLALNGEVLMNLPIVWAFVLAAGDEWTERSMLAFAAAGALIGTAFLLKQPAAIAIVPLFLYVLHPSQLRRRSAGASLGRACAVGGGALLPLAVTATWFISQGTLAEAVYWTIGDHDVPHVFLSQMIERTALFVGVGLPLVAAAVMALWHPLWAARRVDRLVFTALTLVSAIGVAASGRFFPHYYIALVPPLSLLAAPVLAHAWRVALPPRPRGLLLARASQVWIAAAVVVFFVQHTRQLGRLDTDTEEGQYIREHTAPADRIFVWGRAPRVYLDARRRAASRYIHTFPLTGHIFGPRLAGVETRSRVHPGAWANLRADFAQHPPLYIVDMEIPPDALYPAPEFPDLAAILASDYEQVATLAASVVYRRRKTAAPGKDQ